MSALPEHILLVENDLAIFDVMAMLFTDESYAVTICGAPWQAMTFLDRAALTW